MDEDRLTKLTLALTPSTSAASPPPFHFTTPSTSRSTTGPSTSAAPPPAPNPTIRVGRPRQRNSTPVPGPEAIITPPFEWSGNTRAKVRSLEDLRRMGITHIWGEEKCKKCNASSKVYYNLEEKFGEVYNFIIENIGEMNERAPRRWSDPVFSDCGVCRARNSMNPVISDDELDSTNWLFMFLGQTLGYCTISQLKYFLQHNRKHRTAAKHHLLYSVYIILCHQLHPNGGINVLP